MTEAVEITPEELAEARDRATAAEAEATRLRIESARLAALRKHPQLQEDVLNMFQGTPEQIGEFADKLAASIPASAVTAPVSTPGASQTVDQQAVDQAEYNRKSQSLRSRTMEQRDSEAFYQDSLVGSLRSTLERKARRAS